jgi:two-component system LytT family response regulator
MMEKQLRCIIVDDENKARRVLKAFCEDFCPQVSIIGEADSADSAEQLIRQLEPDFIFLDIHMPVKDGFQLLQAFDSFDFKIIFTTAYDEHAVEAFRFNTVDYLLKPIDIDDLIAAVDRVSTPSPEEELNLEMLIQSIKNQMPQRIAFSVNEGYVFLEPPNIIRCEAFGNYIKVIRKGGEKKLLINKTLTHFEDILSEVDFFRIHRSHLVNLHQVKRLVKGRPTKIIMSDDSVVEVSSRKKDSLIRALNAL